MRVTGYKLREAIKQQELRKDALERVLEGALKVFPGEEKPHPRAVIGQIAEAERAIAMLQTAQVRYNLTIDVEGVPLSLAIKTLGGLARIEKLWRKTAGEKKDRYGYQADERDPLKHYAAEVVSPDESMRESLAAAKRTSELRASIASANAVELDVPHLEPQLFL